MPGNWTTKLFNRMLRRMSRGMQEELDEALKEISSQAFDPQKLMEMARSLGIDMSQMSNMMGQGQAVSFDPYQVLGLDRSASDQEVRDRYNELLHKLHPDKSGTPGTKFLLQMVMASYEMIKKERGL